jgi:hypothetical protein
VPITNRYAGEERREREEKEKEGREKKGVKGGKRGRYQVFRAKAKAINENTTEKDRAYLERGWEEGRRKESKGRQKGE